MKTQIKFLMLIKKLILISLLIMTFSLQAVALSDTCLVDHNRNILKTIFVITGGDSYNGAVLGHEVILNRHLALEYIYSWYYSGSENGSWNNSFRAGIKYYLDTPQNNTFLKNLYLNLFLKYRKSEIWIDQTEMDHIDKSVFNLGFCLGKIYVKKWFIAELGYNVMGAYQLADGYGHDQIEIVQGAKRVQYTHKVYYYQGKASWEFFHGPRLLVGIKF